MADNTKVAYAVLGTYLLLVLGAGFIGAVLNFRNSRIHKDKVREHYLAGKGLGTFIWFWTMMATLFSGYSVSGIVNEAYNSGWMATRWIPGGVGLYVAFAVMAPRLHALSKRRGYFTISEVIFDRFSVPSSSSKYVAHALHIISFFCLQVPVFTYLITQFQAVGREVRTYTYGEITPTVSICTGAAVLLACDLLGGMRAVAYTDLLQGVVLFFGSIIFLIIQQTELGGLDAAHNFWSNPALAAKPNIWAVQRVPTKVNIVAYFDFVFKTTVAATMFPHLTARLFAARDAQVIRRGMSTMVFTFFVVQLASMITGWTAIAAIPVLPRGTSAFGMLLRIVSAEGSGQAFASALLLAAAICAMMSTADSALLACSGMWVRDIYTKYFRRNAGQVEQILFGKIVAVCALAIGVALGIVTVERGKPDLSALFALQNVTPIHVAPAVWLGLHWRSLRGEAVLAGMVVGLAVTFGITFSDANIVFKLNGSDMTESGLSGAWIGFCANMGLVLVLGTLMHFFPKAFRLRPLPPPPELTEDDGDEHDAPSSSGASDNGAAAKAASGISEDEAAAAAAKGLDVVTSARDAVAHPGAAVAAAAHWVAPPVPAVDPQYRPHVCRWLDIGTHRDKMLNPWLWAFTGLVLLFTVPFYRVPASWDGYVGAIGAWPFTSLLLSGVLAVVGGPITYLLFWENYKLPKEEPLGLPTVQQQQQSGQGGDVPLAAMHDVGAAAPAAPPAGATGAADYAARAT